MTIEAQITLDNAANVSDPLAVLAALQASFGAWSNELAGNATIQVIVNIEDFPVGSPVLAQCRPLNLEDLHTTDSLGREIYESDCAYQLRTGLADPNGLAPDMEISINAAYLSILRTWFDPTTPPGSLTLIDLLSELTHEIGHGIGFTGFAGSPFELQSATPFDEHRISAGGTFYFDGPNANQISGGVPILLDASGYHIASLGDLMTPELPPGRTEISDIDRAILADLGLSPKVEHIGTGFTWFYDFQPMSADGRYVAFESTASNLVPGDTNGVEDVFVYDRLTHSTERVSIANDGTQGDWYSYNSTISADGRYVAFISGASNLVAGGSPSGNFVYDRLTHTIESIPLPSDGSYPGQDLTISPDGRYVAFQTSAIGIDGYNHNTEIFIYDHTTHAMTLVASDKTHGLDADDLQFSADGRYLVFGCRASSLVEGAADSARDVFVYDQNTHLIETIPPMGDSNGVATISADGRYVAFQGGNPDSLVADINIFVYDRLTHTTELVSLDRDGTHANDHSIFPSISGDGRYVVYSVTSAFLPTPSDIADGIYVYDRTTHTTVWVGDGAFAEFSEDGQHLVIDHRDGSLVVVDTPHFGFTFDSVVLEKDTGTSKTDFITQDGHVMLTGTVSGASSGATVEVFDGASSLGFATVFNGSWWLDRSLSEGTHNFSATLTDDFGDRATNSGHPHTITVDTTPPAVTEQLANDTGTSASDKITKDATLSGTGDPNVVVHFTVDGTQIATTATANASGVWTFTPTGLADGSHTIVASETDVAGNTGTTTSLTFMLDTISPSVAIMTDILNKNGTFTLTGTAETGTAIKMFDAPTLLGSTTNSNGQWTFTTSALSSSAVHVFTSTATDIAGNVGTSGAAIYGTSGNNTLAGTSSSDIFTGGAGADTFVFTGLHFGRDVVTDLAATGKNHDILQFDHTVFGSPADALSHSVQVGKDVAINFDAADIVTLVGVQLNQLSASDFHIV
jgi:hypothetical protein